MTLSVLRVLSLDRNVRNIFSPEVLSDALPPQRDEISMRRQFSRTNHPLSQWIEETKICEIQFFIINIYLNLFSLSSPAPIILKIFHSNIQ